VPCQFGSLAPEAITDAMIELHVLQLTEAKVSPYELMNQVLPLHCNAHTHPRARTRTHAQPRCTYSSRPARARAERTAARCLRRRQARQRAAARAAVCDGRQLRLFVCLLVCLFVCLFVCLPQLWLAEDREWTMQSLRKERPPMVSAITNFAVELKRTVQASPRAPAQACDGMRPKLARGPWHGAGRAGRSPAWSVEWYCHGWGTQVDVTEAIRSSRGGMVSFGIIGGKTITTYCSSRFSDRNMRPRLILGVAAQKKERKAAGQKATGEL
jgi:hypothetical protein